MILSEYLDTARRNAGIPSDARLSVALGISHVTLRQYRLGMAVPQPARMLRLAELAGIPPERALLDRLSWQADDQVSRDVVSRMLAMFMGEVPRIPLNAPKSLGAAAVPVTNEAGRSRYIMERIALCITLLIHGDRPRDDLRAA